MSRASAERVERAAAARSAAGRADLLGSPSLVGPDGRRVAITRPQVQVALTFLLLEHRPAARDELAELLWGHEPLADHWQGAVRGILSKARDLLAEAGIDGEVVSPGDGTVRVELPPGFAIDVDEARVVVDAAGAMLAERRPGAAALALEPWLAVLERPFLAAGDGDWVRAAQDRVAELARRAATIHAAALLSGGQSALAVDAARSWVQRHPLDEAVHQLLIEALLADGRRAEALDAYERLEDVLAEELGVRPRPEVGALVREPSMVRRPGPAGGGAAGLPPSTATVGHGLLPQILLGRDAELAVASDAWHGTLTGRRPVLLEVSGRAGVGKTRLARELTDLARAEGATVRWARCTPGSPAPFEPLATAVRAGRTGRDDRHPPAPTDPSTARTDALAAIRAGVQRLAAGPAVLVVDDVQWASAEVLTALEHTLVDLDGPLLVVTTGRGLPAAVHEALARLSRVLATTPLELRDLERDDLLPLFDGDAAQVERADELHRRTGGHPLFVAEIAIAPWRVGRPIDTTALPGGVRAWIAHRADALDPPRRAVLDLVAAHASACGAATVSRCCSIDEDEALSLLEALVRDGLLAEAEAVGTFGFAHVITRDAIYERIGASRRARLHGLIADDLASLPDAPGRSAEIAHHLLLAGAVRSVEAARHLLDAGRGALDAGAWAEAEAHFRRAAELAPSQPAIRASALTGTARSLHLQRRRGEAEILVDEVLAIARVHRLPLELAEAVLVLVGRAGRGATQRLDDLEQAALLREALDELDALEARSPLDDHDPERRAERLRREALACRVEGELAQALYLTTPPAERATLIERAVARARSIDPPDTHLTAEALLISRAAHVEPEEVEARRSLSDQVLAIAPTGRSVDATLAALTYRHEDLLLCGDREAARAALAEATALAERSDHPYWSWAISTWRALGALIDGDLERAEQLAFEAAALQAGDAGAQACLGVNLVDIRLHQGRAGEVLDLLATAADAAPHIPCYRAVHALCAAEAGDDVVAAASLEPFRSSGFAQIPHDSNRLLTLVVLADTAVRLGDVEATRPLRELLLPAAGLHALLNCYGGGGATWGPVAHQLARIDALAGRAHDAARWFAEADAAAQALGAPLSLARIRTDPLRTAGAPSGGTAR